MSGSLTITGIAEEVTDDYEGKRDGSPFTTFMLNIPTDAARPDRRRIWCFDELTDFVPTIDNGDTVTVSGDYHDPQEITASTITIEPKESETRSV